MVKNGEYICIKSIRGFNKNDIVNVLRYSVKYATLLIIKSDNYWEEIDVDFIKNENDFSYLVNYNEYFKTIKDYIKECRIKKLKQIKI